MGFGQASVKLLGALGTANDSGLFGVGEDRRVALGGAFHAGHPVHRETSFEYLQIAGIQLQFLHPRTVLATHHLADGAEVRTFRTEPLHKYDETFRADIGGARSLAFSADGKLLGAGGTTNVTNAFGGVLECAVASIDWEAGKLKVLHLTKEKNRGTIWGLAWHADGYWIGMSGGRNALLAFWKPDEAQEFAKFALPDVGRDGDLAHDGLRFVIAGAEGQLSVCSLTAKTA